MNPFKRHLLAISLVSSLALPLTAIAGMPSNTPKEMGPHQGPRLEMMAELDLTDEQRNALQETRQTFRQEHQALREQERTAIDDILTEEQRASLSATLERHQGAARHDQRQARQQVRLDALLDSWSLSDEDRATLNDARQALMDKMRALHDATYDSREEKRAAIEALRQEHQAALADVLNEAQRHALVVFMMPHHDKLSRDHLGGEGGEHRHERHGEHKGSYQGEPQQSAEANGNG
ncbi:Spy/CpxP family protein refolding chaperone [Halomonas sp. I5-271120]|uniref:Spy/CpxP family protein refolding chaperone n=1 Tax=Halomonas sp. I5-271120 TaxID=3061632 RepID=UPI002714DD0F|nr:Spy/CpxP family protein refolding chaperone [Halomonas sp. I5-271120]